MTAPLNNINGSLVNVDGSNYSGSSFTSRVIPSTVNPSVLPEPLNNIQAANSYIPGLTKGGKRRKSIKTGKTLKKTKIKNIGNMYKMIHPKNKTKTKTKTKRVSRKKQNKLKTKMKSCHSRKRMSKKVLRGGYAQYQNNLPLTQTYSLGGKLEPSMSALATPPPQHVLSNCTNCVDNYSYFTNKGFPSRGWW